MRWHVMIPLFALAVACSGGDDEDDGSGVNEDNFAELYLDAYCGAGCTADLSRLCDATSDTTTTGSAPECNFDADAAADCVDPANWSCAPLTKGSEDTFPTAPASCVDVCG